MTRSLRITKNPRNNLEAVSNITQDNKNKNFKLNFTKDKNETTFNVSSILNNSKNKNMKNSKNTNIELISCFVAEPSRIDFLEYGIGVKMVQTLILRNISAVSRTLRVLPPRSDRFFLSPLLYPSGKYVCPCASKYVHYVWGCRVIVLDWIGLDCSVLCCAVLCCAVLCCAALSCTVLYCTVLYCTVEYYNALSCVIILESIKTLI